MARKSDRTRHPTIQALIDKKSVISAVILRDMRTRFFNHGLGFILVPLWPLTHMGIVIAIHALATHGAPPFGESSAVFYMTGILPFLSFSYISRFMGYSLVTNKSMLAFPVVKISDVLIARAFLEVVSAVVSLFFMTCILYFSDQDPFPWNLESAIGCYLCMIYLAFACGYAVAMIAMVFPMAITVYQLLLILLYVTSGVFFVPSNLPDGVTIYLSYNPVVCFIEWLRTAYYESYSDKLVSVTYILSFSSAILCIALIVERLFARRWADW